MVEVVVQCQSSLLVPVQEAERALKLQSLVKGVLKNNCPGPGCSKAG